MNNTLTLLKMGFESSTETTPEFKRFIRTFKSEFNKLLQKLGCTGLECHNGHFYISGFFNSANGQLWYFNLPDVVIWFMEALYWYELPNTGKTTMVEPTDMPI